MLMTSKGRLRRLAGIAETSNVLFLRLALRNRGAANQLPGLMFREYVASGGRAPWRSESIFEFLPELVANPARVTLEHLPGEGVNTAVDELAYLALITAALRPSRIFEIGTFRGRTALNFAINSPPDCEVLTLDFDGDIPEGLGEADRGIVARRRTGEDYQGRPEEAKITQLFGDSSMFDFSPWYGQCDIVFVDGGHTYDLARGDTEVALKMCRPGGVIIWHDWANYGAYHDVTRAVLDVIPGSRVVQLGSSELAAYRA